jgi:hypothetical protein
MTPPAIWDSAAHEALLKQGENMTESNDEFMMRMGVIGPAYAGHEDYIRLLALAERGAAIPDEPTEAMIHETGATISGCDLYERMIQTALKEAKP